MIDKYFIGDDNDGSFGNDSIYNRILSYFDDSECEAQGARINRVSISFRQQHAYDSIISSVPTSSFMKFAGGDIASVFMPYQLSDDPKMPSYDDGALDYFGVASGNAPGFKDFLPVMFDPAETGSLYDRYIASSGDSLNFLLSSDQYYGSLERLRDISDIRGIALRLPMMAAGWGFTTDGFPFPSGTDGEKFKGNHKSGCDVDPKDYVVAPVDFRYDTERHVWTCGPKESFYAEVTLTGYNEVESGFIPYYSWSERKLNASGTFDPVDNGKTGTRAYCINNVFTAPTTVRMRKESVQGSGIYVFDNEIPAPTDRGDVSDNGWFRCLTLNGTDKYHNRIVWDYPRFY